MLKAGKSVPKSILIGGEVKEYHIQSDKAENYLRTTLGIGLQDYKPGMEIPPLSSGLLKLQDFPSGVPRHLEDPLKKMWEDRYVELSEREKGAVNELVNQGFTLLLAVKLFFGAGKNVARATELWRNRFDLGRLY
jgi:hypothetical protein